MTEIRVGVNAHADMLTGPLSRRRALLERAEQAGLDHVFVADHVSFHGGVGMDGLVQAATLAALSETLEVHVGVYLLALRHPVPVARQISTLCESAPGRLVLGVGVGGEDRTEIEVCGVDPRTRGRRTDESLAALRGLLSGEETSFDGEFFQFEDALILPAPSPIVPLVVGGRSDAALRRAGRFGDGWLGLWYTPERYAQALATVEAAADVAGRSDTDWQHGLQVWSAVDSDGERGRARLAETMERFYHVPYERFERSSPAGSAEEIASFLHPYLEAGCRTFNVMSVSPSVEDAIDGVAEVKRLLT